MFIEEKMKIRVTDDYENSYTGSVYKIVIQSCEDDNNRPHAILFISQDKKYIEQEGEFGCASLWVDKLKSIEIVHDNYNTSARSCQSSDIRFCDKLRELRADRGKTQKDVAREIGTSERVYQRYENNEAKPSYEQLIRLADYFDVSIDYLTGRT